MSYREIKITMQTAGGVFYGIQAKDKQLVMPDQLWFDHSILPAPA